MKNNRVNIIYQAMIHIRNLLVLLLAAAVAACGAPAMKPGAFKNSIPVSSREMLEEVQVIAVPAFYDDRQNWKEVAYEVLFPSKRVSALPPAEVDRAVRAVIPNFSSLNSQQRQEALGRLGRNLRADAVLNGMLLQAGENAELLLQLISLGDGRILYWQSVELAPKDGVISHEEKKVLMNSLLSTLLEHAGKRKKQPPVIIQPKPEPPAEPVKTEPPVQQKPEHQPKPEKKQKKSRPAPASEKISPM